MDIAILSVEQRAAIEVCNIRNGVELETSYATKRPWLSPTTCREAGVYVWEGQRATGRIRDMRMVQKAAPYCKLGSNVIGCAVPLGEGVWDVYYEPSPSWVKPHEICHAIYQTHAHTDGYLKGLR